MLKILVKKQLTEIFRSYFYDAKNNKARSKGATAAYLCFFAVLMIAVLGGIFASMAFSLCLPLSAAGADWLYFAVIGLIAILLGTFGSVFSTYSELYLAKDNNLLLSMPIPVNTIIASRLLSVYLMGLMYSGVVMLPASAVYFITVSTAPGIILCSLLFFALISIFVLTLSCLLGWVVAKISRKLKRKSIITVFVSLLFMGAYYVFYFKAQTIIDGLLENIGLYSDKIKSDALPIYVFGRAGAGDPLSLAAAAAVVLILFALMWLLLSRSFFNLAASSGAAAVKGGKVTVSKPKRAFSALLAREFRRFASSPNYMLNCGLGIILLPLGGVFFALKGGTLTSLFTSQLGLPGDILPVFLCAAVCLLAAMNTISTPAVSLEGKSLWIMQSLPVKPRQVLGAKLSMQLILTLLPAALCIALTAIAYQYTAASLLAVIAQTFSFVLSLSALGLVLDLKMPNLNWTNETTPIKRSISILLIMLCGFFGAVITAIAGFLLVPAGLNAVLYLFLLAVFNLLLSALWLAWLCKKGCRILGTL